MRLISTCMALALSCGAAFAQPRPVDLAPPAAVPTHPNDVRLATEAPSTRNAIVENVHMIPLTLESGSGQVLNLSAAIANVFVADPKIAEVRPASAKTLFVFGSAPGRTTLAAMDDAGHVVAQYMLTVRPSAYNASEASASMARAMPGSNIRVETTLNGLTVSGQVATPADARTGDGHCARVPDRQADCRQPFDGRIIDPDQPAGSHRRNVAQRFARIGRQLGGTAGNWQIRGDWTGDPESAHCHCLGAGHTRRRLRRQHDQPEWRDRRGWRRTIWSICWQSQT